MVLLAVSAAVLAVMRATTVRSAVMRGVRGMRSVLGRL